MRQLGPLLFAVLSLVGCAPTLVSPYDADLQKRASDMTAEVVAWDASMHTATQPVPVADVNATLSKWDGEAAAMIQLAASIDPGTINCNKVSAGIMKGIQPLLPKSVAGSLPPPPPDTADNAPAQGCESAQVSALADDLQKVRHDIATNCKAPQLLPDSAAAPPVAARKPAAPDLIIMDTSCRAWFGGGAFGSGGLIVYRLVRDLGAIVYIESRKKPSSS